ncbi:PAS domain-containing sensor histidine kinase [Methanoregula sp.]|uniref:PAS domain-containing sensor histidine kinase n=1 Tax=Methanoregula sp. TaxID=2052170 RepID=UPI00236C7CAF|nr:PAS domain-containing sensor histidine kinase [Methanoregula sp.]MDD1686090.1 PAS domain S-box protein [Methanoregula sp.]
MGQESEQNRIRSLLKDNPKGLTIEDVSKKLSLNRATAAKYLNSMMISGQAEMRELGRAKIFYLSQRLPLINLLSLSSDLILILDRDLFIQEVNEPFLTFFNQTKEDLKGKKIEHSCLASWFSDDYLASLEQALAGTEVSYDVHFGSGLDDRYFKMKMIPLVFESGSHAVGIILEDISEMKRYQLELEEGIRERTAKLQTEVEQHKRAEMALRENDAVLRSMLDATPVGVGLLVDRVFKKVNNSLCDITGYTAKELTGRNTRILYPDDNEYSRINQELYNLLGEKGVGMLESRMQRKDGTIIDVSLSVSPFDPKNPDYGVTTTIMDITERKRAEDALKRAGNEVALLTSITRHDILNKLTVLRGYIGYMKKQELTDKFAEILKKEEAVADLIAKRIMFTRDYKDVGVQPPDWIDIADAFRTIRATRDLGPVSLQVKASGLEIYADPLIKKVFSYLIDNSLQHGGKVTGIRVSASKRTDCMVLMYEDNGRGIPADEKEKIFDREYEADTGLELFLSREILAITGIAIAETGTPDRGVRFEMTVPKGSYRFTET